MIATIHEPAAPAPASMVVLDGAGAGESGKKVFGDGECVLDGKGQTVVDQVPKGPRLEERGHPCIYLG